jgi:redox-sensitive bicupin YhaK (pirin superfamily)
MLHGKVEHGDSLGNGVVIEAGDVQWMTAGSGIIHQEMPKKDEHDTLLWGFQLWANLPASQKMMDPRYRDVKKTTIPEVSLHNDKVKVKIISGEINGVKGPIQDVITDPQYLDVTISPYSEFIHRIDKDKNVFAYTIEGEGFFDDAKEVSQGKESLIIFNEGDAIKISTEDKPVRFLLVSGKPLREPVAWRGPIVMNTEQELDLAFREYQTGTFLKHKQ